MCCFPLADNNQSSSLHSFFQQKKEGGNEKYTKGSENGNNFCVFFPFLSREIGKLGTIILCITIQTIK